MDECLLPGVCLHGHCVNLDGTHKCTCNHGYQVTSDEKSCEGLQGIVPSGWGQHTSLWCSSVTEWCLHSMSLCQMSMSVRSVTHALEACASTPLVPTFVRTAGSDLDLLPTDWVAKVRSGWIRPTIELRGHIWCLSLLLDVDECSQENFCLGGVCANTEGSYSCTRCKDGYRVSPDRQRCEGRSHLSSPLSKTY